MLFFHFHVSFPPFPPPFPSLQKYINKIFFKIKINVRDINNCYFSSLGAWEWPYLTSQVYDKDRGRYQGEPSAWHTAGAQ